MAGSIPAQETSKRYSSQETNGCNATQNLLTISWDMWHSLFPDQTIYGATIPCGLPHYRYSVIYHLLVLSREVCHSITGSKNMSWYISIHLFQRYTLRTSTNDANRSLELFLVAFQQIWSRWH